MNYELNTKGGWIVPANSTIPANSVIPGYSELGDGCTLGYGCKLGNYCTLGYGCTLGDYCTLGDCCTLGDGCAIGNCCTLGDDCTWLGVTVESWLTLANVDSTGRQVKVVKHASGIKVEAGCFAGTLEEFTAKAESEGKLRYVAVIKAIAEVL